MILDWSEEAEVELCEAAAYYEHQNEGLGDRFITHVLMAVTKLMEAPLLSRCFDHECRKARVERFPYAVIYWVRQEEVKIIAVMHLSRRPGYWKDRLGN